MNEKEVKELIQKGYVHCRVIFEMAGNPKEHVEESLKKYISAIKQDPDYVFMNEYYADCEEHDGIWSTFMEAKVLAKNLEKLNILCFNLSPASIEIIEPESFNFTEKNLTDWYNDLLSKIHEVSIVTKSIQSENDLLKNNLGRSIRNLIMLAVSEPKTIEEISNKVGIDVEHLKPFIDFLLKEKTILQEGNKYIHK